MKLHQALLCKSVFIKLPSAASRSHNSMSKIFPGMRCATPRAPVRAGLRVEPGSQVDLAGTELYIFSD